MRGRRGVTLGFVFMAGLVSAGAQEPAPKGERKLGLGITSGAVAPDEAFSVGRKTGIQFVEFALQWDEVETRPGAFNGEWLDLANLYYPSVDMAVVVTLNPLDTSRVCLPADLRGKPFDDPELIARYLKFVDFVLDGIPKASVVAISLGNEIDGCLGQDREQWAQYTRLFKAAAAHVRRKRPGVPVGTKVMLPTLIGEGRALGTAINEHADAIFTTYYPLNDDFQVKPPKVVHEELGALSKLYPKRPIYLLETGYPSGNGVASSQGLQAEFVREVFRAWDRHREQIRAVNFVWLHDISQAEAKAAAAAHGSDAAGFRTFLGTLGLRTHTGADKPAFKVFKEQARVRGW